MESDSDNEDESKRIENNLISRYLSNVSDVFLAIWVRCPIQIIDGSNWFVLGTDLIFYLISGCFWLSYIFFSRKISSSNEV